MARSWYVPGRVGRKLLASTRNCSSRWPGTPTVLLAPHCQRHTPTDTDVPFAGMHRQELPGTHRRAVQRQGVCKLSPVPWCVWGWMEGGCPQPIRLTHLSERSICCRGNLFLRTCSTFWTSSAENSRESGILVALLSVLCTMAHGSKHMHSGKTKTRRSLSSS